MKYTFSDEEDYDSDAPSPRRSNHQSGVSTPAEHLGPTFTASGRQVRSRLGGMYGETILVDQRKEIEHERALAASNETGSEEEVPDSTGRPRRTTRVSRPIGRQGGYGKEDRLDDESEEASSGNEWSGDEEEPDEPEPEFEADDEDEEMSADETSPDDSEEVEPRESLVVQLRYKKDNKLPQGAVNGILKPSPLRAMTNGDTAEDSIEVRPAQTPSSALSAEPRPNYPQSSLPQHSGPSNGPRPFTNGASSADEHSSSPERMQEERVFQQAQVLQM